MTLIILPSYTIIHCKTTCITSKSAILSGVKEAFYEGKTTCFTFIPLSPFRRQGILSVNAPYSFH